MGDAIRTTWHGKTTQGVLSLCNSFINYYIFKGHERLARMLLVTRRNYPVAIKRSGWKNRGNLFTEFGVLIRSVKSDQSATVSNKI